MTAERARDRIPALMKALFVLVSTLLVGALGYAMWIVISYWDQVGV